MNKNEMKKVLIIIPAYNEEKNILNTYKKINELKISEYKIDCVVINDGSTDNTRKILIENKINFIDLPCNLGIGGGMQSGYKYAYYNDYDVAIQFDGDGQHNEKYIINLLNSIFNDGFDFCIGSRFVENLSEFRSTKSRRMGINILSLLITLGTGKVIKDVTSGFRASNKSVIALFSREYPDDYPEPETIVSLLKKGFLISEIPVEMNERKHGVSSINKFKSMYYMLKVSLAIIISLISFKGVE